MPRVSKVPRYYDSKKAWYANIQGTSHLLVAGPRKSTEAEARQIYAELMEALRVLTDADRAPASCVLTRWLLWTTSRHDPPPVAPNTYEINQGFCRSFEEMFGDVRICDLRPHHFDEWLAAMSSRRIQKNTGRVISWNAGTKRLALSVLRSAFQWASTSGALISVNPFKMKGSETMKSKRINYKGVRLPIEPEEHRALLEHSLGKANKDFASLLMLLWGTGARPGELYRAEAREWNEALRAFEIQPGEENVGRFKLARLGEVRTVYVPDDLVPLVKVQMELHPTGPLFLDLKAEGFTVKSIAKRFEHAHKILGIRKGLSAYSYRHAFVTRWMETRGDVKHLAALLGTSVTMIEKHYSHLFRRHQTLRDSLQAFGDPGRAGRTPGPTG